MVRGPRLVGLQPVQRLANTALSDPPVGVPLVRKSMFRDFAFIKRDNSLVVGKPYLTGLRKICPSSAQNRWQASLGAPKILQGVWDGAMRF